VGIDKFDKTPPSSKCSGLHHVPTITMGVGLLCRLLTSA
jgi:hypothetical protein